MPRKVYDIQAGRARRVKNIAGRLVSRRDQIRELVVVYETLDHRVVCITTGQRVDKAVGLMRIGEHELIEGTWKDG